jgi:hypothetical protein
MKFKISGVKIEIEAKTKFIGKTTACSKIFPPVVPELQGPIINKE